MLLHWTAGIHLRHSSAAPAAPAPLPADEAGARDETVKALEAQISRLQDRWEAFS